MKTKQKTQQLVIYALLSAIIIVVSFLPIRTLGLEITLSMVPVAVGAALYGPVGGTILGGVFGLVSFITCFGYSPFGAALLAIDPIRTFLVCVPSRMLAGALAGLAAYGMKKVFSKDCHNTISQLIGSITAPILNTVFFMSTLCLCFYNTDYIQGFVTALGAANPIIFILLFVGINGVAEIIAGIVLAFPITKAVAKVTRQLS